MDNLVGPPPGVGPLSKSAGAAYAAAAEARALQWCVDWFGQRVTELKRLEYYQGQAAPGARRCPPACRGWLGSWLPREFGVPWCSKNGFDAKWANGEMAKNGQNGSFLFLLLCSLVCSLFFEVALGGSAFYFGSFAGKCLGTARNVFFLRWAVVDVCLRPKRHQIQR